MLDDDDYGDIFITQEPSASNVVSLEENNDFQLVKNPQYSDISDVEDDPIEERIRYRILVFMSIFLMLGFVLCSQLHVRIQGESCGGSECKKKYKIGLSQVMGVGFSNYLVYGFMV